MIALAALTLMSCGGEKKVEGWVLNGTIEGGAEISQISIVQGADSDMPTEYKVENGKFTIKGTSVSEPKQLGLYIEKPNGMFRIYVENGVTTLMAEVFDRDTPQRDGSTKKEKSVRVKSVDGSVANKHFNDIAAKVNDYRVKNNASFEQAMAYKDSADIEFIKSNPSAFYSGQLVWEKSKGVSDKELKELLAMLSPDIKCSYIGELRKKLSESKDVDFSEVIKASNVSYKVDNSFDGSAFKGAKYLGVLANGNLVALNKDKSVTIIDGKGAKLNSFSVSTTAVPSTLAVDEKDNIFVLVPTEREVEATFRGRKMKKKEITGYSCDIYSIDGKKIKSFSLNDVKEATGARVAGGKLMVADMMGRGIDIFNAESGAKEAEIKDMRPCCGILDFDINDKNELLVANLGAFRVQSYDMSGKQILAFGSRGDKISDFHGCCNPVSLAYLSNGAIVTVEKDPTRVKVFSKDGAIAVAGIDEMVKGCSYIPMTADNKDNLYLASPTKGVVKCIKK